MKLVPCTKDCSKCELEVGKWCFGYGVVPSDVLLYRAMLEKGWDEEILAHQSGVSESSIKRMLSGDQKGSLESWIVVSEALGVNLDRLVQVRDFADW